MRTHRKTAKILPRALLEVNNVLTAGPTACPFPNTMSGLRCKLAKKVDQEEGDKETNQDWSVTVVNKDRRFKTSIAIHGGKQGQKGWQTHVKTTVEDVWVPRQMAQRAFVLHVASNFSWSSQ
jgi:hypothetical protein